MYFIVIKWGLSAYTGKTMACAFATQVVKATYIRMQFIVNSVRDAA